MTVPVSNDVLAERLSNVEGKLDAIHADVRAVLHDHEERLRSVERWTYAIPASLMAAVASIVVAVVR